jgi:hypothetical protein
MNNILELIFFIVLSEIEISHNKERTYAEGVWGKCAAE